MNAKQETTVSKHAISRFIERVMEMEPPEYLPANMREQITDKIMNELEKSYPIHHELVTGNFTFSDLGVYFVKSNNKIITVKKIRNDNCSMFRGGIMKSGNKRKKHTDKKAWKDQQ